MRASRVVARLVMIAGTLVLAVPAFAQLETGWSAPRFEGGAMPETPTLAVSGGEVLLEATVSADGRTSRVTVLRSTPPFTDAALAAIGGWQFQPAETSVAGPDGGRIRQPVESHVLVGFIARPPTLVGPTLGTPPEETEAPSNAIAFPTDTVVPDFPPQARDGGSALVEIEVDPAGRAASVTVLRSTGGFDTAALDAARAWRFRPAQVDGLIQTTYAYVVFSWRQPVTQAAPPRPR